jgi:hypothetical protein
VLIKGTRNPTQQLALNAHVGCAEMLCWDVSVINNRVEGKKRTPGFKPSHMTGDPLAWIPQNRSPNGVFNKGELIVKHDVFTHSALCHNDVIIDEQN